MQIYLVIATYLAGRYLVPYDGDRCVVQELSNYSDSPEY